MPSSLPTPRGRPRLLVFAVVTLLALTLVPAAGAEGSRPTGRDATGGPGLPRAAFTGADVVPGDLIVTTDTSAARAWLTDRAAWATTAALGLRGARRLADRVAVVRTAPGAERSTAAALLDLPGVVAVEPNRVRAWSAVPNDPRYPAQWAHQQASIEGAWDTTTGDGALVAVLDSGIDATHPDLQGVVVSHMQAANGQILQGQAANDECDIGHGTAVAGVIGAQGNNGNGVAGVLWAPRIIDVALTSRANGCPPGPPDSSTIAALDYVASLPEPPLVANLSLGGLADACTSGYQAVIDAARAAGVFVVASAGNEEERTPGATSVPASCNGVLSVGATRSDGAVAVYSNQNQWVDIAGPGGDTQNAPYSTFDELLADVIATTCLPGGLAAIAGCVQADRVDGIAGTSFSGPYVAGVAALLRAAVPTLTLDQVEGAIENTALDAGPPGRDPAFGHGIVQAAAAMAAALSGTGLTPEPDPDFPVQGGGGGGDGGGAAVRVSAGGAVTEAITQAVAVSQSLFPAQQAFHAVIARADVFADALSGSALGYGVGPLLYSTSHGGLAEPTRLELQRVLPPGSTVYLMGGTAALPAVLEDELRALGYQPVRFAGLGREQTAALAADEVRRVVDELQFGIERDWVLVATGGNWPDAVGAGQLAAFYGIPILLTPRDQLNPDTRTKLQQLAPQQVFVIGGDAVVSDAVLAEIDALLPGPTERLAGDARVQTTLAVTDHLADELVADQFTISGVVAVNLRREPDAWAHVLSATQITGGLAAPFIPLEGDDGSIVVRPDVPARLCGFSGDLVLAGGADLIADTGAQELADIMAGQAC